MQQHDVEFTDYNPLPVLSDFPTHRAKFKWLVGGVGSSKSYSLEHQAILLSMWYAGNFGVMGRRVEHILEKTTMRETVNLAEKYNLVKRWQRTKKILTLINDSVIAFYPMNLPITEYGSINAGFVILDEASEIKPHIIKYMVTRLRMPETVKGFPLKQEMCLGSTWEGHNHLWRMFLRDNKDDEDFQTWKVRTSDNPYLPSSYERDLRKIHSEEWCKRYLDCEAGSYAGLVYDEFDPDFHMVGDFLYDFDFENSRKCLSIDTGLAHPTAITVCVLDEVNDIIYQVDEWNKSNQSVPSVARAIEFLMNRHGVNRHEVIIDPASQQKEQTSKTSVRQELRKYLGFMPRYANKNKTVGIEKIKRRLTIRPKKEGEEEVERAGFYMINKGARQTSDQMLEYVWVDSTLEEFDIMAKEEPKKQKDDLMDSLRYNLMELDNVQFRKERQRFGDPRAKIPYYKERIDFIRRNGLDRKFVQKYL